MHLKGASVCIVILRKRAPTYQHQGLRQKGSPTQTLHRDTRCVCSIETRRALDIDEQNHSYMLINEKRNRINNVLLL